MMTRSETTTQDLLPTQFFLSLGWRLALLTTLIISLVMGGISVSQQWIDEKNERSVQQELLRMSLVPLKDTIELANSLDDIQRFIKKVHESYINNGYLEHHLELRDTQGVAVASTLTSSTINLIHPNKKNNHFKANIPVVSPLLQGGAGSLILHKDPFALNNMMHNVGYCGLPISSSQLALLVFFLC